MKKEKYCCDCYDVVNVYAVGRQISMLFMDNKESVFCWNYSSVKTEVEYAGPSDIAVTARVVHTPWLSL